MEHVAVTCINVGFHTSYYSMATVRDRLDGMCPGAVGLKVVYV